MQKSNVKPIHLKTNTIVISLKKLRLISDSEIIEDVPLKLYCIFFIITIEDTFVSKTS